MKPVNNNFRIGDVAKQLEVKEFVIRFWEREFKLRSQRSTGGQRSYSQKDVEQLIFIKSLLYDNGYTIAGAKKHLKELKTAKPSAKKMLVTAAQLDTSNQAPAHSKEKRDPIDQDIVEKLTAVKQYLIKLKELL